MKFITKNRWFKFGGAACGLSLVGYAAFAFSKEEKPQASAETSPMVAVVKADRQDLKQTMSVTGEVRPYQQIDLHAKVAGYLQSISVDIGDHVRKGEVIAVLEIPELGQELDRAQAATEASQENVKSAQARYADVHLSSQRLQAVAAKNPKLIAQQDLDNANSKDRVAAADLASAQQQEEECKAAEAKIRTMLSYSRIVAPFDGVVTKRYADEGALIQAGTSSNTQSMPVVSLAQDDILRATFPAPESVAAKLRIGDDVKITLPDTNRTISARISRFSHEIESATRTMEVQVDLPNPNGSITPGAYALADFDVAKRQNVLSVPVQAVKAGDPASVYVVDAAGKVEKRDVSLGMQTPDLVEVCKGLKDGDLVIIGDTSELQPGMHVTSSAVGLADSLIQKGKNNG